MIRHMMALAGAAVLAGASVPASAAEPVLRAIPAATAAMTLPSGVSRLGSNAFVYVPRKVSGAAPLIVLLHPAGGKAEDFLREFTRSADQRGAMLMAMQASRDTWTLKPDGKGGADFGADPAALDQALTTLFGKAPIDPQRVAILGYSDGASYALSVGLANPTLFKAVVALSPGTVWLPPRVDAAQRIFVAHGIRDDKLPFRNVRETIVPGLEKAGLKPQTRFFNGGHEIDHLSVDRALDYALGK
jgi:phospholipase/carboxylesterase